MRSVSIIGVGCTSFGEHWQKSLRELVAEAGIQAVLTSGLVGKDIEAIYGGCMASGRFIAQEHIGALLADQLGLNPIPSTRVEAACASGGVALRSGFLSVASGAYDIVAVGGVEKMTEVSTSEAAIALGGAGDQETELFHGASFPALYALMARKHMHDFGTTEEQMALCSVQAHKNGMLNPNSQFHKEISVEEVMHSGYVASPLKLLDCSPITDGAAAVILCETEKARKMGIPAVEIIGAGQASDSLALSGRKSLTEVAATKKAAEIAYKQANLGPKDIDVVELHDCFSIANIMAIEDLGFFKKGEGGKALEQGKTALNSEISVNPSGGLKCGHPVGATGVKQAVEIFEQLLGKAGKRQVKDAKIGLAHNVGGSGATAVVHIMRRL
ncbi:MAG: thiolase domain-containing protein [Candidatus Diapherotrites archaeon]|uniref:Thiolase domain-containing protein n=1 Tax=Candidatus Iainarchaeum sp. TaxID=3101447 RepID=A0A938YVH2_9ARCH|nr:thiolase domain-containing protein [Candidatus Diapherotrites archaeon]